MNRIILIGNGFDLAHGLPTRYIDFIQHYWTEWDKTLASSKKLIEDDGLYSFGFRYVDEVTQNLNGLRIRDFIGKYHIELKPHNGSLQNNKTVEDFNQESQIGKLHYKFESQFLENINISIETYNWVDIENEYYKLLKKCFQKGNCSYKDPQLLNKELKILEQKLSTYLLTIQQNFITSELINENIQDIFFEPFKINDISIGGQSTFFQFAKRRLDDCRNEIKAKRFLSKYGYTHWGWIDNQRYLAEVDANGGYNYHEQLIQKRVDGLIPPHLLLPEEILLLNFNYTNTADLYLPKKSDFKINNIHGKLETPNNPIIFGYGDELDEDYKVISNLNDNDYLENIKSIRYLETDNYRQLLKFIDSAPYQIYIMGHSCGNSDRTLLNTLFEHKNCISIKPFYHQKEDGTDNYIDIIQNISRDFNDMTLMRDRVVNKGYCQPLVAH